MFFLNYLALYLVLNVYVLYGYDMDFITIEFVNYFVTFNFNLYDDGVGRLVLNFMLLFIAAVGL